MTVVMAAYDAAATVGDAIRSVLAQSWTDFELVVVDDGSRDATAARVEAFGDRRIRLVRQANGGAAAARNTGIEQARGPLVSMLDSDDLLLPDYLERMAAALLDRPGAALAWTDAWCFEEASGRFRRTTAMAAADPPAGPLAPDALVTALARRNFVFNAATVRRDALLEAGGYDAGLSHAEDWDLWLRIARAGHGGLPVAGADGGPLAIYRDRAGSLSGDEGAMLRGMRVVYDRLLADARLPAAARDVAQRERDEVDAALAQLAGVAPLPRRLRRAGARATRALRAPQRLRPDTPPAVAAVFPALRTSGRLPRPLRLAPYGD